MGANPSPQATHTSESFTQYLQKLDYVMQASNPNFASFKIYKMTQKPYEYIMRKDYSSMVKDFVLEKRKERYEKIPQHKNLVNLEHISLRQVQGRCSKHLELSIFCKYYFFTLEEAILKKLKKQQRFPEEEIYYVAKTILELYSSLHEYESQQYGLFRSTSIFLTPEGFIKIYPTLNEWKQQVIEPNESINNAKGFFTFSSEHQVELDLSIEKKDLHHKEKPINDIFDIGVIILSMISVAKESDYRTSEGEIKEDIVKFVINSHSIQTQNNKSLSIFRLLLKGIFEQNWPNQKLKNQLQNIERNHNIKSTTRIKIINPENEDSETTLNGQFLDKQRKSRLKLIPKKQLIPGRIRCYSVTSTSCQL